MNTLTKLILFSSPVLFFVLFFVISSQKSTDVQIKAQEAAFEMLWNENEAQLSKDPAVKKRYEERAKAAQLELQELRKREKEREEKDAEFEKSMGSALKDSEEELKEKLK